MEFILHKSCLLDFDLLPDLTYSSITGVIRGVGEVGVVIERASDSQIRVIQWGRIKDLILS